MRLRDAVFLLHHPLHDRGRLPRDPRLPDRRLQALQHDDAVAMSVQRRPVDVTLSRWRRRRRRCAARLHVRRRAQLRQRHHERQGLPDPAVQPQRDRLRGLSLVRHSRLEVQVSFVLGALIGTPAGGGHQRIVVLVANLWSGTK